MPAKSTRAAARPSHRDALVALRRQEILSAAIRLFGRKGFAATRAEDIALAARVAKGTVYLYFRNKEAIYTAAVAQAVKELQQEIRQRSTGDASLRDRLATAMRVRLEFWPEHEEIYRLLLTAGREPRLRRQTNEVLREAQQGLARIFEDGVTAGEIASADFEPLAWAALDLVRGATERRMDKLSTRTPQQDAEWITGCLLEQLRPPAQRQHAA